MTTENKTLFIPSLEKTSHYIPRTFTGGVTEDAMYDLDIIIDDLKEILRQGDHRLGDKSGIQIWQAAEATIDVTYGEPLSQKGTSTETWATVRFIVTQMIQA